MKRPEFVEEIVPDTWPKVLYFRKIGLFELVRDGLVLDVGCGTGYFTRLLGRGAREI